MLIGMKRPHIQSILSVTGTPAIPVCMTDLSLSDWSRAANEQTTYPIAAGVYALFLNEGATIPGVKPGEFGLVYVGLGQGTRGLAARCHFKGKTAAHSPRRSLAALLADELGLRPVFIRKPSGATTFKLDKASEHLLDQWMEANLRVALQVHDSPGDYERELIRRWEPPLNCDKKVCPLNAQQLFVLDRREMFKAHAARLTGNG